MGQKTNQSRMYRSIWRKSICEKRNCVIVVYLRQNFRNYIWQIPLGSLTVLSVEKYISILSILIAGANIISHLHFSNLTLFWDDDSDTLRTYPNTFVKSFLYSFS